MNGGTITNNRTADYGGGVYIYGGTFSKTGNSIITGYADDTENGNRVGTFPTSTSKLGHAVYAAFFSTVTKRIESTVGEGVDISYYYNNGSPIWWGNWE
jgi:hypothetical protein